MTFSGKDHAKKWSQRTKVIFAQKKESFTCKQLFQQLHPSPPAPFQLWDSRTLKDMLLSILNRPWKEYQSLHMIQKVFLITISVSHFQISTALIFVSKVCLWYQSLPWGFLQSKMRVCHPIWCDQDAYCRLFSFHLNLFFLVWRESLSLCFNITWTSHLPQRVFAKFIVVVTTCGNKTTETEWEPESTRRRTE